MNIRENYLQLFTSFLIKNRQAVVLNLCHITNLLMKVVNQLLEKLKEKNFILNVKTADVQLRSKYDKGIWYFLCGVIFLVNMHRLFL